MTAPVSSDARLAVADAAASERPGAERAASRWAGAETIASAPAVPKRAGPEPRAPGRLAVEPQASQGAPEEAPSSKRTCPEPAGAEVFAHTRPSADATASESARGGASPSERTGPERAGAGPPARGRPPTGPAPSERAAEPHVSEPHPRLRVGFLLAPRFTLSAFANFVDVLRLAADEGDRSRPILCDWRVLSPSGATVRSSCGVVVAPDERPGDPRRFDYLAVVGGLLDEVERLDRASVAYLGRAAEAGVPLIGLCTGAFTLHEAGLMEGRRACVSWFHHEDFLDRFEGLQPVSDRIFVVDRGRLTCSGGVGSAHLAAWLVERHVGRAAAAKSLRIMIVDEAHEPDAPQPAPPLETATRDPLVRRALLMMRQSLDAPPSVAEIARRLGVDRRRLERRFRAALGESPARAGRALRLAQARHLLASGGRSVAEIAAETGFCDASHLTRAFREAEGTTPEAWRRARAGAAPEA